MTTTAHILRPMPRPMPEDTACKLCGRAMRRRHRAAKPEVCVTCVDRERSAGRRFRDDVCSICRRPMRSAATATPPCLCRACLPMAITPIQADCIERRADCLGSWHPSPCLHALLVESQAIGDCCVQHTQAVREALCT